MKISELSTKDAASALCVCATHITNIVSDTELVELLAKGKIDKADASQAEITRNGAEVTAKLIPLLLEKHFDDVCEVLAALQKTTVKKVSAQKITETMAQIKEVTEDKDFWDFFTPYVGLALKG